MLNCQSWVCLLNHLSFWQIACDVVCNSMYQCIGFRERKGHAASNKLEDVVNDLILPRRKWIGKFLLNLWVCCKFSKTREQPHEKKCLSSPFYVTTFVFLWTNICWCDLKDLMCHLATCASSKNCCCHFLKELHYWWGRCKFYWVRKGVYSRG